MTASQPIVLHQYDQCVDATLDRVGKRIVLGLPVGIGKPNGLVNAFVRRAVADPCIHLTIFTALSLRTPRWRSDLERRFLQPFVERVFGDYEELEYVRLLERTALPANIQVNEFFLEPGAWLRNAHLQQHYLSANYTHVARDLIARGVNVIAQLVAVSATRPGYVSLSCNPDLTVDLLPPIDSMRANNQPFVLIGEVHPALPYMYGDAEQPKSIFDFVIEAPKATALFFPPNMPIGTTDYMIAMNVAALVRDGGTLQLGIGELGDAIVYALKLRQERPGDFNAVLSSAGTVTAHRALIEQEGGLAPLKRGVYGCTEMLVDGFIDLYKAGILNRRVYPHAQLQRLLDAGHISEAVSEDTLLALAASGVDRISSEDFKALQFAGVFNDSTRFEDELIVSPRGERIDPRLAKQATRAQLAQHCLGASLHNGVLAHGGFFFGPQAFYQALRSMSESERAQFAMQRISFINELYGSDAELKVAQRRHARFVNTTMMVTALGAAVSDGLADGEVVSGIGGQYNFVAMAHALPEARSILCVRSTRSWQGRVSSNIVWNYAHTSIPRHLRDIVITEYGIADLRGKTDCEVIEALIAITDARFQDELVARAIEHGKLPKDYTVPAIARLNTPQRLESVLREFRLRGLFGELPFGSDFTDDEITIAKALRFLQSSTTSKWKTVKTLVNALFERKGDERVIPLLERLALTKPTTLRGRIEQSMVAYALKQTLQNTMVKQK